MTSLPMDEKRLKELLKQAITELLQEQPDMFSKVMAEALEDVALTQAIQEGETSGTALREDVFKALQ